MDMVQIFHMNKGEGHESYAKNSIVQNKILSITKPFVEEALEDFLDGGDNIPETLSIADLGCSSGPNALTTLSEILDIVAGKCGQKLKSPKFMVFLNDLPGNDFNEVFSCLPSFKAKMEKEKGSEFGHCFIAGLPGSFHGRLLPENCLHFVHSSSSLHWLSQVPSGLWNGKNVENNNVTVNKGKIYISKTSPRSVISAYEDQFRRDFHLFLENRAKEVIPRGKMVLSLMGRMTSSTNDPSCENSRPPHCPWELIAQSLMAMVSEGLVEEEKVDGFNVPYYAPSIEELKEIVEKEGCFKVSRFEGFQVEWDGGDITNTNNNTTNNNNSNSNNNLALDDKKETTRGERIGKMHRAVIECMLDQHFKREIVDELFIRHAKVIDLLLSTQSLKLTNFVILLTRK